MPNRLRLASIVLGAFCLWATLVYTFFHAARQALWEELRAHLMAITQAVALSIDPKEHEQVVREGREESALYQRLTQKLQLFASLLLPEEQEKGPVASPASALALSLPPSPKRLRVLTVGDEPGIVATLKAMLQRDGHQVHVARNGEEAQQLLLQNDYDAILCDLKMPRVNGTQLFEWLRSYKPSLVKRFVVMTGELTLSAEHTFREEELPILQKPFRRDDLRRVLNQLPA